MSYFRLGVAETSGLSIPKLLPRTFISAKKILKIGQWSMGIVFFTGISLYSSPCPIRHPPFPNHYFYGKPYYFTLWKTDLGAMG
jgi:hypothetical protein